MNQSYDQINIQVKNINPTTIFYLPTKADVDFTERQLRTQYRKLDDELIGTEEVLDQIEINCNKAGNALRPNWRDITRRNIEIWFGKNK
jgi:hypothetical protein